MVDKIKALEVDTKLILQNQHAIMLALLNLTNTNKLVEYTAVPILTYQIERTDEAIGKNRVKDD